MKAAEKLREQAARARGYAKQAAMADDRAAWLAIAERWERLAEADESQEREGKTRE